MIVPPVEGLNPSPGALPAGVSAQDTLAEIRQAILANLKAIEESAQRELIDLRVFTQALNSDPDWKPLQKVNNFEAVKTAARAEAEQRGKNLEAMLALLKQIAKQLENDLKGLGQGLP